MQMQSAQAVDTYEFTVPLITEDELRLFIEVAFGVHIPDVQACPNHSTPWRAFCDAYFARSPIAVWKASRGLGGKTFLLSMLSLVEALTLKADVNLLGGSGEQSRRVLEHLEMFWKYPNAQTMTAGTTISLVIRDVQRQMNFAWGNKAEALVASQTSVRGPHPQRLRLDEIDEMDIKILDAALGEPMSKGDIVSQVVESSTHQYADGTMTECLRRAVDQGYPVFEWCFKESMGTSDFDWLGAGNQLQLQLHAGAELLGWLQPLDVERKRRQMTAATWNNEVALQEPSPESRAIQPGSVQAMFKKELGVFAGGLREDIRIEQPQPGAYYAHGADWAKKVDRTILWTFRTDVRPIRLVAFMALQREEYPVMVGEFAKRIKAYPGPACHDGTGLGEVVNDILKTEGVLAEGFIMKGRERADLLSNYIKAIEDGVYEAPMIRLAYGEHLYASVADVYRPGETFHLPDTIAAGALANRAVRFVTNAQGWIDAVRQQQVDVTPQVVTLEELVKRPGALGLPPAIGERMTPPKPFRGPGR